MLCQVPSLIMFGSVVLILLAAIGPVTFTLKLPPPCVKMPHPRLSLEIQSLLEMNGGSSICRV